MFKRLLFVALVASAARADVWQVSADLQKAINIAADGDTLLLAPGRYVAEAMPYEEARCGNCLNAATPVHATRGFVIDGKRLVLRGRKAADVILETHAGYGLLMINSHDSVIEWLTITGGVRDVDGKATDGAIVLKHSQATIRSCFLRDNTHFIDSVIVGIGGVMVREGSNARIEHCAILHNSWDGVALYRGALATISDCAMDSGRGVGIGVTWDAAAVCLRNNISHYWKGIGSFGTATVVARNNAVYDNLGWGMIAAGASTLIAENNVIARNGNCGLAIWNSGTRGRFVNNIAVFNGWRKQWVCPCVGFWNQDSSAVGWTVSNNIVWGNVQQDVLGADSTGFLFVNPQFADTLDFSLERNSPARGAGDEQLTNSDGSRSDIGLYGGPLAKP
jgi:hypothetical protein